MGGRDERAFTAEIDFRAVADMVSETLEDVDNVRLRRHSYTE